MLVGPSSDPIRLSFALEAKRYSQANSVGVKEVSRLISRIKHREFGVFETTSAVNPQAYKEIRSDQHPIVIITGRDIVQILAANGVTTPALCLAWVKRVLGT
jgi:restriction endonuclease Mrr